MVRTFAIPLGALFVALLGYVFGSAQDNAMAQRLAVASDAALAEAGYSTIDAQFANRLGMPSRHPYLSGGEQLDDDNRTRAAILIARIRGVGGVSWADGSVRASAGTRTFEPLHCQQDVDGLLRTRTIRFAEASTALLPASRLLLAEVAEALEPCAGAIIAITGHTDASGNEAANVALSLDRARVVREALVSRGIPRESLRARGVGSSEPMDRLTGEDPANRRIEFSVIRIEPVEPTPVDTPGPR